MSHFPIWWLIWLAVVVVFAVVRGVFVRKASAKREQERRERAAERQTRQSRPGPRRAGASRQSPQRANGQPLATRDQLIAIGAIIPAAEPDVLPADPIA
jgi:flagellar biosynthesis/type III secretory pathway M-ring protein FliF/YscJ